MERLVLEGGWIEEQLTASVGEDEWEVIISVAAEHAVDSYNTVFDSAIHLTKEQAQQLFVWLGKVLFFP